MRQMLKLFWKKSVIFSTKHLHCCRRFQETALCEQYRTGNSTALQQICPEKGGCFKIANINENVYEIIEIIGATSLLEIYDEVDEAVAALN